VKQIERVLNEQKFEATLNLRRATLHVATHGHRLDGNLRFDDAGDRDAYALIVATLADVMEAV
jgi:hypothetical protein